MSSCDDCSTYTASRSEREVFTTNRYTHEQIHHHDDRYAYATDEDWRAAQVAEQTAAGGTAATSAATFWTDVDKFIGNAFDLLIGQVDDVFGWLVKI
jgi:hypothetical protein